MSSTIRCYLFETDHGLVFDPQSICLLRQQYRIVGCLTGSLADDPRQNNQLGVPLELSLEECYLLLQREIISLYRLLSPIDESEEDRRTYLVQLDREFQEQQLNNGHERINEILINRDSILNKAKSSVDNEEVSEDPFLRSLLETNNAWQNCLRTLEEHERLRLQSIIAKRLKQFTPDCILIENPTESKRSNLQLSSITVHQLEEQLSPLDQLRCDVFRDLYDRTYWISDGENYGGDYIVYTDDPSKCHSTFIVTCVLRNEINAEDTVVPLRHLIGRCRVAVNVNKRCVLASRKSGGSSAEIEYLSLNWMGF